MCMMALLYRARTAHAAAHGTPAAMQSEDELWGTALPHVHDARMPQRFVAITGVYDIRWVIATKYLKVTSLSSYAGRTYIGILAHCLL